ncbi:MAG: hypothetical protein FVQ79_03120 [Planctomycetes bacterium]|nr:hypothetical protein [Planctomycetota bacterium]
MRNRRVINERDKGIVLIVILFIVAMISVLSFGFAVKADRELSFGENVGVRMKMDCLSQTGLNYGKSLVMNPQNVSTGSNGYWEGGSELQMEGGSDYFDITVAQAISGNTMRCTYNITSEAYRKAGESNIATSAISGVLRLDPCIGYVQLNNNGRLGFEVTVNGDVYCGSDLFVEGMIRGDLSTAGSITWYGNNVTGDLKVGVAECPVSIPILSTDDYSSVYYIDSQSYHVEVIDANDGDGDLQRVFSASNPAGVFYCDGDLELKGKTEITGMLVVKGDLIINNEAITITAVKNFPALLVGDDIRVVDDEANLDVTGLTQVNDDIDVTDWDNCRLTFDGALHVLNGSIKNTNGTGTSVIITADPMAAALKTWSSDGSVEYWMPAGDAFFRSIARN